MMSWPKRVLYYLLGFSIGGIVVTLSGQVKMFLLITEWTQEH